MRAPIQLQCIFSYAILANPGVEPHAPNTYQSKLLPSVSINSNKCEGLRAQLIPFSLYRLVIRRPLPLVAGKIFPSLFGDNSLLPN